MRFDQYSIRIVMQQSEQIALHIHIIGASLSGRSSLVEREVEGQFRQFIPSCQECSFKSYKIGQKKVQCIFYHSNYGNWRNDKNKIIILNKSDAFGMCFSFHNIQQFQRIYFGIRSSIKDPNKPIWLIGTKADLMHQVDQQLIDRYAEQNGLKYIETSAKENIGVKELFQQISFAALKFKVKFREIESITQALEKQEEMLNSVIRYNSLFKIAWVLGQPKLII